MGALKRVVLPSRAAGARSLEDSQASDALPALVEFLTLTEWAPGEKRVPGTVLLCSDEGLWKGWLHDKDAGLSCWVSGASLRALVASVEKGLADGSLEWRRERRAPRRA